MQSDVLLQLGIIAGYLAVTLALGYASYRMARGTPQDFFLADRNIGPVVLFFTLIATNFSAFFFLGFAGAGYRIGYSYYGIMGLGTAFVAIAFYFLGHKIWQLGREKGYITPSELIGDRLRSEPLKVVFLAVMVIFTLPYLALQPIGAGILLENLSGGTIPYFQGAVLLTVIIVGYVFLGGMRSVAWTDLLQGVLMFVLMLLAVKVIGDALGGLPNANARVMALQPELFSREGAGDFFTPRKWFSFMVLWILCVPMFPQMFMRFFVARSVKPLQFSAIAYPFMTAVLFICPIIIGVLGHLEFPELAGKEADNILPLMLDRFAPAWLTALIMVGALAAFMSTMDSQLLALSSMLTRDLYLAFVNREASLEKQVRLGKWLVIVLALAGLVIAWKPPSTILQIATQTFTGLAVLFPTTLAALYWQRTTAKGAIASILVGELLVLGFQTGIISDDWAFGFLPVIPIVAVSALTLAGVSLLPAKKQPQAAKTG